MANNLLVGLKVISKHLGHSLAPFGNVFHVDEKWEKLKAGVWNPKVNIPIWECLSCGCEIGNGTLRHSTGDLNIQLIQV